MHPTKDECTYLLRLCLFTSERFHVLLNSLFKVLFNFPSWYLFAIGLVLYLALDGAYHPIWAAFPNNPTLGTLQWTRRIVFTGLTPSMGIKPQSRGLKTTPTCRMKWTKHHISREQASRFGYGLFPLRSPLLGESLLVSFPPLIDMLKFSG